MMIKKQLLVFFLAMFSLACACAQSAPWIWQPRSEGPYFDYSIIAGEPKQYYDAGGPDKNMPGNAALTLLRLKPTNSNAHITIIFEEIQIGQYDEMRIYEGLQTLNNYPNEDGEYVYDWPKNQTPVLSFKGNPSNPKLLVSSTASGGELTIAFRCNSTDPGWKGMIYCIKNGDPEPDTQPEMPANISCAISPDLGQDSDGEEIDETDLRFTLGAAKEGTAIQIDWGEGKKDYTIGSKDPVSVSQAVRAGATVKIYGELTHFDASGNKVITGLTLHDNPKLSVLRLSQNKIAQLDLINLPEVRELMITDNKLANIDLSHLVKLEEFYGGWNDYTEIRTTMNPQLKVLTCYNTKIKDLDLSKNERLEILTAGGNKYDTGISLTANTELVAIDLENADLVSIDLSRQAKISKIRLSGNALTELDVTKNPLIRSIDISHNRFEACSLNDLFFCLPKDETAEAEIKINNNPGTQGAETTLTAVLGWRANESGDGQGCPTARLLFVQPTDGTFTTAINNQTVAEWTPITKGLRVQVVATPAKDYTLSKILLNGEEIMGTSFEMKGYATLAAIFASTESTEAMDLAKQIAIRHTPQSIVLNGLLPNKFYTVYGSDGTILCQGLPAPTGRAEISIPEGLGLIVFRQGAIVIKTIR